MVRNPVGNILCSIKWNNGFVQGPVLRKALKKFSEEKLVIIGSIILGTNFVLFASNNLVSVFGAVILFALCGHHSCPYCQEVQNSKEQYKALLVVLEPWLASLA